MISIEMKRYVQYFNQTLLIFAAQEMRWRHGRSKETLLWFAMLDCQRKITYSPKDLYIYLYH